MNTIEELIEKSETRIFKAVFPNTTNHYETLFGGTALQLMDEASFICATRFSRKKVVTISSDKVDFEKPIPGGTIIELIAKVELVGRTSCTVKVDIYKEDMYSFNRELAVTGSFKFVAIGNDKKPIPIVDAQS
ncbi:acyl-CoA thioesterase [Aquimarina spongiae]|uniref:Acyl-CoA hydrolase n=1 Tax=Aquimarina spongiae TaxID=570521 RepID=A0A1M6A3I1_9FLAO|nr:acyl-CoA thioesterase [Aquimarina spongiae]SHI31018.1 Acyl-CoA hydrolase [Aquimarina spongiae]